MQYGEIELSERQEKEGSPDLCSKMHCKEGGYCQGILSQLQLNNAISFPNYVHNIHTLGTEYMCGYPILPAIPGTEHTMSHMSSFCHSTHYSGDSLLVLNMHSVSRV